MTLKKIFNIVAIISFIFFLLIAFFGIGILGEQMYWGQTQYSLYNSLGVVFVPILGAFYIFLIILNIYNFNKDLFVIKILNVVITSLILGIFIAQLVILYVNIDSIFLLGHFVNAFIILTIIFSGVSLVIGILQLNKKNNPSRSETNINQTNINVNAFEKLREIHSLYLNELISKEEYEKLKEKYVDLL